MDVTLHRANYTGIGILPVFRVDVHEPTSEFLETYGNGRIPPAPTKI